MDIANEFVVPLSTGEAWRLLLDIKRITPCVPGAELIEILDERTYKGKVSVRLGPVALAFIGTARFEEVDEAAKRAKVLAKGSDAKGRGGANAVVQFRLEPIEAGVKVMIETSLNLSGSVAQYGRGIGVIQGVAAQLTSQFARNLNAILAQDRVGDASDLAAEAHPTPTSALPAPSGEPTIGARPLRPPVSSNATSAAPAQATAPTGSSSGLSITTLDRIEAAAVRAEAAALRIETAIFRVEKAVARVELTSSALTRTAHPPTSPMPRAKPISGFSLMLTVLWNMITGLFSSKKKV